MSERERYPAGVPCWVETLQEDPLAALDFYGPLFGWEFVGPGAMPGDSDARYFVACVRGRDVAGIGSLPEQVQSPVWATHIRVDSAEGAADKAPKAGGSLLAGPLDVFPAGRLAVLADPAGAVICAWEARSREGAQVVNEPRAWAMSLLHTDDPQGSQQFYDAVFGWQAEPFGPPGSSTALWRRPGYIGGEPQQPVPRDVVGVMTPLSRDGSPAAVQPHWSVDFWVADADATAAHAAKLGGKIVVPTHDTPGFRHAVLADPQGSTFSVSQLMMGR